MRTHEENFEPVFYDMKAAGLWAMWRAARWLWRARRGALLLAALTLALVGCTTAPLPAADALVGTWVTTSPDGACASYTFRADGSMTFDNGEQRRGGGGVLNGGYAVDGARLLLAFDGQPTVSVPYALGSDPGNPPAWPAFATLTITDDPTTSPLRTVTYGAHLCAP